MDFPKTIYVTGDSGDDYFEDTYSINKEISDIEDGIIAIYELKEVKKKVTEVKLEDI